MWQRRTSKHDCGVDVLLEVRLIEVFRYPTGTKLAGIVFVHQFGWFVGDSLESSTGTMEELCEDSTLKNLVIMIHQWREVTPFAEALLQSEISSPNGLVHEVVQLGAKIYRCTGTSKPDLGALRIILGGRSVVPKAQQKPINQGSESEQTAVQPVEPSKDKEVEGLRRELEAHKWRAKREADVFTKRIAEMQSKEETTRTEMVREHYQELEEQKRKAQEEADVFKKQAAEKEESIRQEASRELEEQKRKAQEEADGLRKCIAELHSELEEDRHASGKAPATYNFRPVPPRSRVFLWDRSLTYPYSMSTPRQIFTKIRQSAQRRTSRPGV